MTEDVLESTPVTEEPQELAAPVVSTGDAEVQPPSADQPAQTEERLEKLIGAVATLNEKVEKLSRQEQSAKDRAISKTAKELAEVKARLDAYGGDWNALAQEAEARTLYQRIDTLEARLSQAPASQRVTDQKAVWQAEWDVDSRKVLDAAKQLGVTLSSEEYNAALFGKVFASKGDAYAALNQVIYRKMAGDSVPAAAVATEGGEVARPPEPTAPKNLRQQLASAKDDKEARSILDAKWDEVEKLQAKEKAREALRQAGVSPEDLAE